MIGNCDCCDRTNVPLSLVNATSLHPEAVACFICQGDSDPDPYGELETIERARLGIDGNCGFALLGLNLQEGEAEFEVIDTTEPSWTSEYTRCANIAITKAYRRLQGRIGRPISYVLDISHPNFC